MKPIISVCLFIFLPVLGHGQSSDWHAPDWADTLKNPSPGQQPTIEKGKSLFTSLCVMCHGQQGKGDGPMAKGLNKAPANLTSEDVQRQSDGALFWKITNGNPPMLSFQNSLSEEKRWQVINYIRELSKLYPRDKEDQAGVEDAEGKVNDTSDEDGSPTSIPETNARASAKANGKISNDINIEEKTAVEPVKAAKVPVQEKEELNRVEASSAPITRTLASESKTSENTSNVNFLAWITSEGNVIYGFLALSILAVSIIVVLLIIFTVYVFRLVR